MAEAEANKASLVPRVGRPEQREQRQGQLSKGHRRSSKNVVANQRDDQVRS